MSLESLKTIADIVKAVFEVAALVVAGVWTYLRFIKKRDEAPKASLTQTVITLPTDGKRLIHVTTRISNSGQVLISVGEGFIRVQQMLPVSDELQNLIEEGQDPVVEGSELQWPLLGERQFEAGSIELEPGESDEVHAEFIIPQDVERIVVYSFFLNTAKKEFGWPITTIHDLGGDTPEEQLEMRKPAQQKPKPPPAKPKPTRETRQQRPKPSPSQKPTTKPKPATSKPKSS